MDSLKNAWVKEYERKGIPSSFRKDPSKTVVEFINKLKSIWRKEQSINANKAADIGCGQGRNSFYLATEGFQVTGIDLLPENVNSINHYAQLNSLSVRAIAQDAAMEWPIDPNSLDIAIDIFCYKHIADKEKQANYRQELCKALKPEGFYFISLASENDGFYGPLLQTSLSPKEKKIIDPYSNIPSFLYSIEGLTEEFADLFDVMSANEQSSVSPMHGKEYQRKVINLILRKKRDR